MAANHKKKKKKTTKNTSKGNAFTAGFSSTRVRAPESVAHSKNKGQPASSLFESLWSSRKFNVVGKKRKGEGRRVGLSRSVAIEKRKKTILQEFKSRGKSNVFLDHRFGENDEALAEEDKAILRFQRERQAQWQRRSKFALPDDDEDEAVLTHGGTALSMLDDFDENISAEDDEDRHELDDEIVRKFHFGGGTVNGNDTSHDDENEQKPKSKKEVMEEVIAKSKFYKAQKSKEREEDAELKTQLDKDFAELAQSQALISLVRPKKLNTVKSMLNPSRGKEMAATSDVALQGDLEKEKPDDFDKLVKEMGMEMRAHASDRLKTDEEIAKEEKARLEELEENRKERMLSGMDSDDSEVEKMNKVDDSTKRKRKRFAISGDDLGDDFVADDDQPEKGWVDEVLARTHEKKEASSSEDEDEGEGEGEDEDEGEDEVEDEDEDEDDTSLYEDGISRDGCGDESTKSSDREAFEDVGSAEVREESDENNQKIRLDTAPMQKRVGGDEFKKERLLNAGSMVEAHGLNHSHSASSLPFVIEAPRNLEELKGLLDNRSVEDLLVVIQRIRACNSIRLAAENRRKMQVFYGILLQYFAAVAGAQGTLFDRLNALVKPLIEMTSETPYFAAVCARQRVVRMQQQLLDKLRNPDANGPWPSVRTLLLLKLWSMIFPTSDFRHVVMTPCTLLMAEYLARCPVISGRDLAVGTFLCALLLSVMRQARRFCPEALSFLYAALLAAIPQKKSSAELLATGGCAAFMVELVASQPWLLVCTDCTAITEVDDLDFNAIMSADRDSPSFSTDRFRIAVLNSVIRILEGFSHIYEDIPCYPEVFEPFIVMLQTLLAEGLLPHVINDLMNGLVHRMKDNVDKHEMFRQPLRMRAKKPTPIKQYNPKFEENFVRGKNYDPDRERAKRNKLQRLLKQEAKGAARELRKDNYFLQVEKDKEKSLIEEQRQEKYRKAMAFLQEQESAFKSGQLGKGRKKRR